MKASDLTRAQLQTLEALAALEGTTAPGQSATYRYLAHKLGRSQETAETAARALVKLALVEISSATGRGNKAGVRLTAAGRRLAGAEPMAPAHSPGK